MLQLLCYSLSRGQVLIDKKVVYLKIYDIRLYKNDKFQIPGTIISSLILSLIDIIGYFYLFCTACIFSEIS
jgi:hypothetical protein